MSEFGGTYVEFLFKYAGEIIWVAVPKQRADFLYRHVFSGKKLFCIIHSQHGDVVEYGVTRGLLKNAAQVIFTEAHPIGNVVQRQLFKSYNFV